jgi:phosphoribosylanthranilate isomerase
VVRDKVSRHTRIKICGITRPQDGCEAAALGADAIGLVFYEGSPRCVTLDQAQAIIAVLPPLVTLVALFLDPTRGRVADILAALPIDLLQFHGNETPGFCRGFARRYLKALPMGGGADPVIYANRHSDAAGFLLDSHVAGQQGGTGRTFDWGSVPQDLGKPYLLAGGLDSDNVAEAIQACRPYGVDVSSGVEVTKGVKDPVRMAAFIREVNRVGSD